MAHAVSMLCSTACIERQRLLVLKAYLQTGFHSVDGVYEALRHGPRCCARYDVPHLHGECSNLKGEHSISCGTLHHTVLGTGAPEGLWHASNPEHACETTSR